MTIKYNKIIFAPIIIYCLVCLTNTENFGITSPRQCSVRRSPVANISSIRALLNQWNNSLTLAAQASYSASYDWAINMTEDTAYAMNDEAIDYSYVNKQFWQTAPCINCTAAGCNATETRRVNSYLNIGAAAMPPGASEDEAPVIAMVSLYSSAKVCLPNDENTCLRLEPDLTNIFSSSRDYCKLQWAWEGWRNETGRKLRHLFTSYIGQENKAANLNGFENAKNMWAYAFTQDDGTFFDQIVKAWNDVKPLYQQLHAHVRRKLTAFYGADKFPTTGQIPAHLLGNMWAQDWTSIYNLVEPYPGAPSIDLTSILRQKNYTVLDMVRTADAFFQSIGLEPMTPDFWKYSVFIKPPGAETICQPSSWDMFKTTDFRIKMCAQVDSYNFQTVHHEMGHITYFMQYKNQPIEFRKGANPGFQEAIGDMVALSTMTPSHLKTIGLLPQNYEETSESLINTQMMMALRKVAFLPFGYLIDKYRWSLFDGSTPVSRLNAEWWRLRCGLQGVSPPVPRNEHDFDAGAKYHVAASDNYMMYFYAYIAQFQFHRALCQRIGWERDFHLCDIYNSTIAGQILRNVLKLGASYPYPQILYHFTGSWTIDASALLDYFAPLHRWLRKQNEVYNVTWEEDCQQTPPDAECNYDELVF